MDVTRIRRAAGAALLGALVLGGLGVAPAASAAITGSHMTTPADPSFFVADEDAATQTFAISGTTTGGNPASDMVDVRCYYGGTSVRVVHNVALNADGSFSVPAANLNGSLDLTCRLRAVPAGTNPSDVTAFSGPAVGVGERGSSKLSGGPNTGKTYDYFFDAQQLTAAFDYVSLGNCGIDDGYLYDPTYANTTITFSCNAGLLRAESPAKPTRSELQIDGVNVYEPAQGFFINSDATGLPSLTDTYTVDAATGNVVIHETDPLVKCPKVAYPPTTASCGSFVSAGVTDNRTITQDHDGHLSWISDTFTSTDGKAHSLDLLWDNNQRFWGPSGNSAQVEYEFPGQTSFSTHAVGDAVSPLASEPGTILIRMHGAADGDMATGQGAIVYDRPAAGATFTFVQSFDSAFTLHQTGSVPAGGSTRFRFAYVQDYQAAKVASLAQTANTAFLNTISCGKTCSHGYGYGMSVTLKAKPARGSRFLRWSGACKGTGRCTITTTDNVTVNARFVLRPCVVPNVVGKTLKAAKRALTRASCSVGKITTATSSTVTKGRVVSQKPKRGRRLKPHAKVALVVSA